MNVELVQNTYITTGPCIFTKPDDSQLVYSSIVDFEGLSNLFKQLMSVALKFTLMKV